MDVINYTYIRDPQASTALDLVLDLCAVIVQAGDITSVTRRSDNEALRKQDVVLLDEADSPVNLTLWEEKVGSLPGWVLFARNISSSSSSAHLSRESESSSHARDQS